MIVADLPDFVSPIDGKVIHGRKGLREHEKEHNVTNVADFTSEWEFKAKKRADLFAGNGKYDKERRLQRVIDAYHKHERRR
jgi:hypothetical protein